MAPSPLRRWAKREPETGPLVSQPHSPELTVETGEQRRLQGPGKGRSLCSGAGRAAACAGLRLGFIASPWAPNWVAQGRTGRQLAGGCVAANALTGPEGAAPRSAGACPGPFLPLGNCRPVCQALAWTDVHLKPNQDKVHLLHSQMSSTWCIPDPGTHQSRGPELGCQARCRGREYLVRGWVWGNQAPFGLTRVVPGPAASSLPTPSPRMAFRPRLSLLVLDPRQEGSAHTPRLLDLLHCPPAPHTFPFPCLCLCSASH